MTQHTASALVLLACVFLIGLTSYNAGRTKGGGPLYNNAIAFLIMLAATALVVLSVLL